MLPLVVLVILTLFTWAVAVWATFEEEQTSPLSDEREHEEPEKPAKQDLDWRNAA